MGKTINFWTDSVTQQIKMNADVVGSQRGAQEMMLEASVAVKLLLLSLLPVVNLQGTLCRHSTLHARISVHRNRTAAEK